MGRYGYTRYGRTTYGIGGGPLPVATLSPTVITDDIANTIRRSLANEGDGLGGKQVVSNPKFTGPATTGWTQGSNCVLTAISDAAFGTNYPNAGRMVCAAAAFGRSIRTSLVNVDPGQNLSGALSAYVEGGGTANFIALLYDPTFTTQLAASSTFVLSGDPVWYSFSFTAAQLGGYTNPLLVLVATDSVPQTIRVTGVTLQPPGDSSWGIYQAETNMLTDAGGEIDPITTYWGFVAVGQAAIVYDTTVFKFGLRSLKAVMTATGGGITHSPVAVTPGQSYAIGSWILSPFAATYAVQVNFVNAGSNYIGSSILSLVVVPANVWTNITATGIAPYGASTGQFYCYTGDTLHTGAIVYFDGNMMVARSANTALTLSGSELTDSVRANGTGGDGRAVPDLTTALYAGTTNLLAYDGTNNATTGFSQQGAGTLTATATGGKFSGFAQQSITGNVAAIEGLAETMTGTPTSGAPYTGSIWLSGSGTVFITIYDGATLNSTGSVITLTATPTRYSQTAITLSTNALQILVRTNVQQAATIRATGWQLEAGSTATPLVHTAGAPASRGASRLQMPVGVLSAAQGWFACTLRLGFASTDTNLYYLAYIFDDANNMIRVYFNGSGSFTVSTTDASVSKFASVATSHVIGTVVTIVGKWTAGDLSVAVNNSGFTTTTGRPTPFTTINSIDIGSGAGTFRWQNSASYWTAVGTGTLVSASATALYNGGSTVVPTWATLTALNTNQASPTALWNGQSPVYTTQDIMPPTPYTNGTRATANVQLDAAYMSSRRGWIAKAMRVLGSASATGQVYALPWRWSNGVDSIHLVLYSGVNAYFYAEAYVGGVYYDVNSPVVETFAAGSLIVIGMEWGPSGLTIFRSVNNDAVASATSGVYIAPTGMQPVMYLNTTTDGMSNPFNARDYWILGGTGTLNPAARTAICAQQTVDPTLAWAQALNSGQSGAVFVQPCNNDVTMLDFAPEVNGQWALAPAWSGTFSMEPIG